MVNSRSDRVSTATSWFTGLSAVTVCSGFLVGGNTKVSLHAAILQLLGHPGLDMLVEFASVHAAVSAFLLADNLPSGLERVGTGTTGVEWQLGSIDCAIDGVGAR